MNQPIHAPTHVLVRKSVHVATSPERAFRVFTEQMGTWWPLVSHHIGEAAPQTCVIEPYTGGRWFERGVDGSECMWGRVLAWEPPGLLVLGWELDTDWKHNAGLQTEVEVRFTREGAGTRVELEHRLLERYGDKAAEMHAAFDSPGGWNGILESFVRAASAG
jgi:uncharacterized protein YndB with AHSA1/START domain